MSTDVPEPWATAMIEAGCVDPRRKVHVASRTQLAHRAGLSVETIRRMIRGEGVAERSNVQAVADVLGDEVFDWVNRARANPQPWEPPDEASLLSHDQGAVISQLIKWITSNAIGASGATVTHIRKSEPGSPSDVDARRAASEKTSKNADRPDPLGGGV